MIMSKYQRLSLLAVVFVILTVIGTGLLIGAAMDWQYERCPGVYENALVHGVLHNDGNHNGYCGPTPQNQNAVAPTIHTLQ
jgi:hypothetical protein